MLHWLLPAPYLACMAGVKRGRRNPGWGSDFSPSHWLFSIRHHQTWRSTAGSYPRQDNHRRIQIVMIGRGTRCSVHNNEVTVTEWITRLWQTNRRNNGRVVWLGFLCILYFLPWCSKLHHFNGTACKTKLHRPHRALQIRNEKSPRLRNVGPKRRSDNYRPMERIIRVPKSVKSLFLESGILSIGIRRNTVKGICRYSVHYICLRQQNSVLFRVVA